MKKLIYILLVFLYACEGLDVPDLNDPDRTRVLSTPRDAQNLAQSAFLAYWQATHTTNLYATSLVAADQFTSSWYNFGWGYVSSEPRTKWDNSVTFDDAYVTADFYYKMYGVLSNSVNPVLDLILNKNYQLGPKGVNNPSILALCYFLQGTILGDLGLCFDKAMIVKENTDLTNLKFSGYNDVIAAAIISLEKTDSICRNNTFQLNSSVVSNYLVDNVILGKLANSYIARFMVLGSRTKRDNSYVEWAKVLDHAKKGITNDFYAVGDATDLQGGRWFDDNFYFLTNPVNSTYAYAFVDCRLINMLDPDYPARYPSDGIAPQVHGDLRAGEAKSKDKRLASDFKYFSSNGFYANRGYYHFSHYQYTRYPGIRTSGLALLYDFRKYENDLYMAEAYAMLNQPDNALAIINNSLNPRSDRGGLDPVSSSAKQDQILDAIFYEREIELLAQGFMVGFCDMRRRDMLQYGTYLHYPVPGKELETLQLPNYTFGGAENAGQEGTSNGGWFK
jgi:starch-binding outer membrane protein, SusD/RagB family